VPAREVSLGDGIGLVPVRSGGRVSWVVGGVGVGGWMDLEGGPGWERQRPRRGVCGGDLRCPSLLTLKV